MDTWIGMIARIHELPNWGRMTTRLPLVRPGQLVPLSVGSAYDIGTVDRLTLITP